MYGNRPRGRSGSIRRCTELQYRLVERVILLGWPRERVQVIDDDLGKSGASSDERFFPAVDRRSRFEQSGTGNQPGRVAVGP